MSIGQVSPNIKLPPLLHGVLKEALSKNRMTARDFFIEAIRDYLPGEYDVFAQRNNRQGHRIITPSLPHSMHERVKKLSQARAAIIELQKAGADEGEIEAKPRIKLASEKWVYQEIASRKLACEWKSIGFTESDLGRIGEATGYDLGKVDLSVSLRRVPSGPRKQEETRIVKTAEPLQDSLPGHTVNEATSKPEISPKPVSHDKKGKPQKKPPNSGRRRQH